MSDNTKRSFEELIKEYKYICIPKIQRDYAQGRENDKVNEIRKRFVHVLMRVVKGDVAEQELDFVYGSLSDKGSEGNNEKIKAFEPLDGQQRLTTLFLLHWMMGSEKLVTSDAHSIFTYETRPSSKEFCNELVLHQAANYIEEAKGRKERKGKSAKPSEIIMEKDWFKWEWKFDPTIQSMLVMIDAINEELPDTTDMSTYLHNLNNITFKELNLENLKASDELFVKMNARGKHLSDFDILKSTLEEELQMQRAESPIEDCNLANEKDEKDWHSLMDGKWIDMFWNKYAKDIINKENRKLREFEQSLFVDESPKDDITIKSKEIKKEAAANAEKNFRRLLLRLIALQLLESEKTPDYLKEVCYHVDENDLGNIIYKYDDYMINARQKLKDTLSEEHKQRIDFRQLINDMNHLIYKKDEDYRDISELLGRIIPSKPEEVNNNGTELLLDVFLKEARLGNDIVLIFYAVLLFLRQYCHRENEAWLENLNEWTRLMRNIFLNENRNQRIDKRDLMENAMKGINDFRSQFDAFISNENLDVYTDNLAVRRFIANQRKLEKNEKGGFLGFENQTMNEEIEKAQLKIKDPCWIDAIEKAESHPYLWGQIGCLINWANNDIELFKDYTQRLHDLLDTILAEWNKDYGKKYYMGILSVMPNCWKTHGNRLYEFNKSRDNSIKRCLRDKEQQEMFLGLPIKVLIDKWREEEYKQLHATDFLVRLQNDSNGKVPGWVQCILYKPETIDYSWRKKVFEDRNHVILAQLQTVDSHCFDPILKSIHLLTGGEKGKFGDSKMSDRHFVKFDYDNNSYIIKWSEEYDGMYTLKKGEEQEKIMSADQIKEFVQSTLL